ncbi:hypothetical protein Tco_1522933 [Tanacetum coccineum]
MSSSIENIDVQVHMEPNNPNNNNTLFHRTIYLATQVLEAAQERGLAVMRGMPEVWRRVEALDDDDVDLALPQSTFTGNPGIPFETHSQMVKIPIASFLIYGLLSAAVYLVKLLAPNPNPSPGLVVMFKLQNCGFNSIRITRFTLVSVAKPEQKSTVIIASICYQLQG